MKFFLIILVFAASCSKQPPPKIREHAVTVVQPIQKDVPLYLRYVGHVEPYTSVSVKSQIEGLLVAKHFNEGDEVKKGDLLFTIDPRPYQAALDRAQAVLAETLVNLKYAEDTVRRYGKIVQENYISQLDYDQYVTQVMLQETTTKQNRADIETAKLNLEYCFIRAPMDAVTGNIQVDVGNLVPNAGDQALVSLNQIHPIYVSFFIPEKDLPEIQVLQQAGALQVEASIKNTTSFGTLTLINNQVDENTGSILLKAAFVNTENTLWPGEFVDVRLYKGIQKGGLLLPNAAVQTGQQGSYIFVVKEDKTVELRAISIGQRLDEQILITSGLKAGEMVVLEGQLNLFPGAHVKITQPGTTP